MVFLYHCVYMINIMQTEHDNLEGSSQGVPLYQQIKRKILLALEQKVWCSGELIPSENDLATLYRVSQGTVRKAIDELVAQHFLLRRQGSGTFVATHQEEQSKYRFLHLANTAGNFEDSQNRILLCAHQKAPAIIYECFSMGPEDIFVHIRRLMSFKDQPVVLEDIWLPCPLFSKLNLDLLQSWQGTMYGLFESHFGTHMVRAHEKITAELPNDIAVEFLKISQITPILHIFRVAYTYGDLPVEVRQSQNLTDDYHYVNNLS